MSPKSQDIESDVPVPLQLTINKTKNQNAIIITEENRLVRLTNEVETIQSLTPEQEEVQNIRTPSTLQAIAEIKPKFEESPYRFVNVGVYILLCFANGMQWVTFSSTADRFRLNYNLNRIQVDLFSMIYMIIYPIVCVPESYLIDNVSLRIGLNIAALFTILGSGLKCLINYHIAWAYVGQILCALFQPAILNSPAKIASVWFKDSNRTLVTSICVTSNIIGIIFGFVYHIFFLKDDSIGEQYQKEFFNYVFWGFIFALIFCIPTFFFIYNKPKKPVSNSQLNYKSPPLLESLKLLFKNPNFNYLLGCTTCIVGFTNLYATILNAYMATYGISDNHASYSFATGNGCGIVTALIVSYFLDKWKKFKLTLIILNFTGLILLVIFTVLLEFLPQERLFILLIIMYSLIICCAVPIFSTAMNYVCELTYPVGESISGGWIMSTNQISGIVGILLSNFFIEYFMEYRYLTNILCILLFVISIVCIWMIKERLLRNEKEKENGK